MAKRREIELTKDGYRTVWYHGPKGSREIHVDIYQGEKLVLEWLFPRLAGNALNGNAAIYFDQAIIYAKNPPGDLETT